MVDIGMQSGDEVQVDDVQELSLSDVFNLARSILVKNGLAEAHATAVAEVVTAGERDECASHGVYRLLDCVKSIRAGRVAANAEPVVTEPSLAWLKVDAGGGFSPLAFKIGYPVLVDKARAGGLAAMAINNCVHLSALWPEIEALTSNDLVGFAFTNSHAWVAPAGGARPLLGTNPIAFGWPRPGGEPFVFDFATSMVARGEIELRRREGREIPPDWAIDQNGQPTKDPKEALKGAMLAFGGHKGSALSLMVELIAGPLIGDLTSMESQHVDAGAGALPLGGELIIAIDPSIVQKESAEEYLSRAEQLFMGVTEQGARLPSQRRYQARARSLAEGVRLSGALYRELLALMG